LKTNLTYSDPELIHLIKQREEKACAYLYDKYAAALQGLINQVLQGNSDSGDVLKKTFVTIFNNIDSYDPAKSRLFTWMLNTARLTAIHELRLSILNRQSKVAQKHVYNEAQGLGKLIRHLNTEEKQLIGLSYFKGYTEQDIARHLNLPDEIAKTKIRFALMRLKALL
jgi:RNA polymerase sigma factor (sigma-70 family)